MTDGLPAYQRLARSPDSGARSAWGVWGPHDRLGALNLLDRAAVLRGVAAVRTGDVFPLDLPIGLLDPPLFGRDAMRHTILGDDSSLGRDDLLSGWNTQASSQWDGFRHIRDPLSGFFGGMDGAQHGVDAWARHGLVGRAVLADVARHRASLGRRIDASAASAITVDDLDACLEAQGSSLAPGDVLLIRTGWVGWYRTLTGDARSRVADKTRMRSPGLLADESTAAWFWDNRIAAAAADNPSFEVWPLGEGAAEGEPPLHVRLLAQLGIPIGELWDLEALASDCAAVRRYESLLVSAPLNLPGGCGSPANAVVVR